MGNRTIRERLDAYTKEKNGIDPEILSLSHEEYEIYRHIETGKWFAVLIVKERRAFVWTAMGRQRFYASSPRTGSLSIS